MKEGTWEQMSPEEQNKVWWGRFWDRVAIGLALITLIIPVAVPLSIGNFVALMAIGFGSGAVGLSIMWRTHNFIIEVERNIDYRRRKAAGLF